MRRPLTNFKGSLNVAIADGFRSIGIAFIIILLAAQPHTARAQCDSATECCAVECNASAELPTADQCAEDSCTCAQQIQCYITEREANWALWPNSVALGLDTETPILSAWTEHMTGSFEQSTRL